MIDSVNSAMLELQSAALARALYPRKHPRIQTSEDRALALLREVLATRPEFTVFAVDERVVFGEDVLSSSVSLATGLFRLLRQKGADHITIRAGLELLELRNFLDCVASSDAEAPRSLQASAHMSFGVIVQGATIQPVAAPKGVSQEPANAPTDATGSLADVWQGIHGSRNFESDLLGDIVSTLSHVVTGTSYTILPLAFVKGHDEYTFVHIINVGILSMSLSEALGFDSRTTHEIGVAALLHDVGKMAVPLSVLNKNGRFTEEEYKAMQVHPAEGARTLLRTRGVSELAAVVAYEHHIRVDGGGYPKPPVGWTLNLASRICQIADVYDALRTDRPYRPGMPVEKILKIMKGDAGTYFDPDLLEVFLEKVVPRVSAAQFGDSVSAASGPESALRPETRRQGGSDA